MKAKVEEPNKAQAERGRVAIEERRKLVRRRQFDGEESWKIWKLLGLLSQPDAMEPAGEYEEALEKIEERLTAAAFLHAHGIQVAPESLDPMVEEAVARLQRILYRPSSRADLTEAEARALEQGGFVLEPEDPATEDPLVLTVTEYAALLKSSLSTSEAAKALGVDPSRIRQRLTSVPPTLYGIRVGSSWYIPEFQFDGGELIPGIGEVIALLDPELHPVAVFRWFTTPNPDLSTDDPRGGNLNPRDWLRLGFPVQPVVELASNL